MGSDNKKPFRRPKVPMTLWVVLRGLLGVAATIISLSYYIEDDNTRNKLNACMLCVGAGAYIDAGFGEY